MKISLCIEPVFANLPLEDRVLRARDLGADAIEFWDATRRDRGAIAAACERANLPVAAISLADSWDVRLCDEPRRVLAKLEETIRMGKDLGCTRFIGLSGEQTGRVRAQKAVLIANLARAGELAQKHGVVVLIEALNSLRDHKGYYLDSAQEGFEIVRAVGCPGVKLLYDVYHMQLMEGNLVGSIETHMGEIGHFHFAGVPGRHEPHIGEIHYPAVVSAIEKAGYDGYCGLEYWPSYEDERSVSESIARLKKGREDML